MSMSRTTAKPGLISGQASRARKLSAISEVDPDLELAADLREKWASEEANSDARSRHPSDKASARVSQRSRRETQAGRLLDELEKHNRRNRAFTDPWCRTLKAIVDLGPAAVPEIIEELDATDNGRMLGCLGFILRGIGDKRAIPGLIRSIPMTLRPPGSDMGLEGGDARLVKFMQQNSVDRAYKNDFLNRGNRYSFGRPIREVFGVLESLSGEKFDEEQLYSVFSAGSATRQRMQSEIFERTALRWARWWEQHGPEYVKDPAYIPVKLTAVNIGDKIVRGPMPGTHFKTGPGGSGHILQSVFNPQAIVVFHDLDTGRQAALPQMWRNSGRIEPQLDDIVAWAAGEGFDIMGTEYVSPRDRQKHFAIRPIGMRAWELRATRWKMSSTDVTLEALQAEGTPAPDDVLLHFDPARKSLDPRATVTFLCVTREGLPALLFVGVEVDNTNVKLGEPMTGDMELKTSGPFKARRFGWSTLDEDESVRRSE